MRVSCWCMNQRLQHCIVDFKKCKIFSMQKTTAIYRRKEKWWCLTWEVHMPVDIFSYANCNNMMWIPQTLEITKWKYRYSKCYFLNTFSKSLNIKMTSISYYKRYVYYILWISQSWFMNTYTFRSFPLRFVCNIFTNQI